MGPATPAAVAWLRIHGVIRSSAAQERHPALRCKGGTLPGTRAVSDRYLLLRLEQPALAAVKSSKDSRANAVSRQNGIPRACPDLSLWYTRKRPQALASVHASQRTCVMQFQAVSARSDEGTAEAWR